MRQQSSHLGGLNHLWAVKNFSGGRTDEEEEKNLPLFICVPVTTMTLFKSFFFLFPKRPIYFFIFIYIPHYCSSSSSSSWVGFFFSSLDHKKKEKGNLQKRLWGCSQPHRADSMALRVTFRSCCFNRRWRGKGDFIKCLLAQCQHHSRAWCLSKIRNN